MKNKDLFLAIVLVLMILDVRAQNNSFKWVSLTGGESSRSVTHDHQGNIYATGIFIGTQDFDPGPGVFNLTPVNSGDGYVTKLDSSGQLVWARSFGGLSNINGQGVAIDDSNNVFVAGTFGGTADFDPGNGTYSLTSNGSSDVFLVKLNSSGQFVWARNFGGPQNERVYSFCLDQTGNLYVAGSFRFTTDFDPDTSVSNISSNNGSEDIYVSKYSPSGKFKWARGFGDNQRDRGRSVAVDSLGNVHLTGYFMGTVDFDPGPGSRSLNASSVDIFVMKLDSLGNLHWANKFGAGFTDHGRSIALDDLGHVYVTGIFVNTVDFDPGPGVVQLSAPGGSAYTCKFDALGNLVWARAFNGVTVGGSVTLDNALNVYTAGHFWGTADFDPDTSTTFNLTSQASSDIFINKMDSSGQLVWAKSLTSSAGMLLPSISVADNRDVITAGGFQGNADFDPDTTKSFNLSVTALSGFIHKMGFTDPSDTTLNVSVCDTFTSPSGRYIWTQSGVYMDTVPCASIPACDSILTINLTIHGGKSDSLQVLTCDPSYTSPFSGRIWTSPGVYPDTVSNTVGCDSVIYTELAFLTSSSSSINVNRCHSYTSPSGNYTWISNGIYSDTVQNKVGCDSIIQVNLTIKPSTNSSINASISSCGSYTSPSGNYIWTTTGSYYDTVPNHIGCDSIILVNLTVQTISTSSINANISNCESYISPSGNYIWTTTGTYQDTIPDHAGCDSIILVNLTALGNSNSISNINVNSCDSYTSPSSNYIWTSSGNYSDTIPNKVGCDSILFINLSIDTSSHSTISITECDHYTSPSGNHIWSASGTYYDTIPNHIGCDSIMLINLTINSGTNSSINVRSCLNYTSPSGNHTWNNSGTYYDTLQNNAGCDSVILINLTIYASTSSSMNASSCSSYISPSGNYIWTSTGVYNDTISNGPGCDSSITVYLTILGAKTSSLVTGTCDSYTSPSGNYTWTTSGTYFDTIPTTSSPVCDSIITIVLFIFESSHDSIQVNACNSYVSPSGNHTWTASGTYTDTILNAAGCDSVFYIDLTIAPSSSSTLSVTDCKSYTSPSGNHTWLSSGTYFDTVQNSVGCDSLITINLSIPVIDTSVSISSFSLTANALNNISTYQWLDCDNGFTPISGATARSFTPSSNGNYAVTLTSQGCTDTSGCHKIAGIGLPESDFSLKPILYPNPTTKGVIVDMGRFYPAVQLEVISSEGRVVTNFEIKDVEQFEVELPVPPGHYTLRIRIPGGALTELQVLKK